MCLFVFFWPLCNQPALCSWSRVSRVPGWPGPGPLPSAPGAAAGPGGQPIKGTGAAAPGPRRGGRPRTAAADPCCGQGRPRRMGPHASIIVCGDAPTMCVLMHWHCAEKEGLFLTTHKFLAMHIGPNTICERLVFFCIVPNEATIPPLSCQFRKKSSIPVSESPAAHGEPDGPPRPFGGLPLQPMEGTPAPLWIGLRPVNHRRCLVSPFP